MHLKNSLKRARPEEWKNRNIFKASKNIRIPIFSHENNEGAFVDVTSVLPNHISFGLDTFLNGEYQKDYFRVILNLIKK